MQEGSTKEGSSNALKLFFEGDEKISFRYSSQSSGNHREGIKKEGWKKLSRWARANRLKNVNDSSWKL